MPTVSLHSCSPGQGTAGPYVTAQPALLQHPAVVCGCEPEGQGVAAGDDCEPTQLQHPSHGAKAGSGADIHRACSPGSAAPAACQRLVGLLRSSASPPASGACSRCGSSYVCAPEHDPSSLIITRCEGWSLKDPIRSCISLKGLSGQTAPLLCRPAQATGLLAWPFRTGAPEQRAVRSSVCVG